MDFDLIIIGAGPAGYVAAIRAGQVGLRTALVEKTHLGGMCLNWGCIPTKALLESAKLYERIRTAAQFGIEGIDENKLRFNWRLARDRAQRVVRRLARGVEGLLAKSGVAVISGEATLVGPGQVRVGDRLLEATDIIIATGSRPRVLEAPIPPEMIVEIEQLVRQAEVPTQVVVYGEGANALEVAQMLKLAGGTVALVAPAARLIPPADPHLSRFVQGRLSRDGIRVYLDASITGHYESGILVSGERVQCERVVNCSLRGAVLPPLECPLELENGFIRTDEYLQTSLPRVYAIGDVNGRSDLAHAASAQGLHVVNVVKGIRRKLEPRHYPLNIYSQPEIAQIGWTEPELAAQGVDYKVSEFPLAANGKALAEGTLDGFLRLLSDKRFGEVLGVQIVAAHATDMIGEAAAILQMEGTVYDMVKVAHAHPTVSEIFLEAGLVAADQPLHI